MMEAAGLNPNYHPQPMRQSIEPTYDSRETGQRYTVEYRIDGRSVDGVHPLSDPFIHGTVRVSWRDLLRGLFRRGLVVQVHLSADQELIEDVMELDANHLAYNSTRRAAFKGEIETALSRLAMTPTDEELN